MADSTYKYLDQDGLARFNSKIQDILDTKVDKETGKYIVTVDESLSSSSTNPVRNSAVTVALNGKLGTSGDSKDNTVTFTSGDVANDAAATSWTADVGTISSGLSHATLLNRLSLGVKNLRYLKNLLGSTDISAIGGGTVTGALSKLNTDSTSHANSISQLNTDIKSNAVGVTITNVGNKYIKRQGHICILEFNATLHYKILAGAKLATIPEGNRPSDACRAALSDSTGNIYDIKLQTNGDVYIQQEAPIGAEIGGTITYWCDDLA